MKNMDAPNIHRLKRGELVSLDGARAARNETLEAKWQRFLAARERSWESRDMADGIAAGKAYAEWLRSFTGGV